MLKKFVEISLLEHKLKIKSNKDKVIQEYDVATGKYPLSPKHWAWDYRTPTGGYTVKEIYKKDSRRLIELNQKYYRWHLANKFRNRYEDAGKGVCGNGIIVLDYPNLNDVKTFHKLRKNGGLKKIWNEFCDVHWRPIYEYLEKQNEKKFEEIVVDGDFGIKTFQDLKDKFPIQNFNTAFNSRIVIHGTNDSACIGNNISGGCIRMHNKDIEELIGRDAQKGMEVRIFL